MRTLLGRCEFAFQGELFRRGSPEVCSPWEQVDVLQFESVLPCEAHATFLHAVDRTAFGRIVVMYRAGGLLARSPGERSPYLSCPQQDTDLEQLCLWPRAYLPGQAGRA